MQYCHSCIPGWLPGCTISKCIKEFSCCSEQVWEWRAAISVADVAGCFLAMMVGCFSGTDELCFLLFVWSSSVALPRATTVGLYHSNRWSIQRQWSKKFEGANREAKLPFSNHYSLQKVTNNAYLYRHPTSIVILLSELWIGLKRSCTLKPLCIWSFNEAQAALWYFPAVWYPMTALLTSSYRNRSFNKCQCWCSKFCQSML